MRDGAERAAMAALMAEMMVDDEGGQRRAHLVEDLAAPPDGLAVVDPGPLIVNGSSFTWRGSGNPALAIAGSAG